MDNQSVHSSSGSIILGLSEAEREEIQHFALQHVRLRLIDDQNIPLSTMIETQFDKLCEYFIVDSLLYGNCVFGEGKHPVDFQSNPQKYRNLPRRVYFRMVKSFFMYSFRELLLEGRLSRMPRLERTSEREFTIYSEEFAIENQTDPRNVCWPGDAVPVMWPLPLECTSNPFSVSKKSGKPFPFPGAKDLATHHVISYRLLNTFYYIFAQMRSQEWQASPYEHSNRRFFKTLERSQRKLDSVLMWATIKGENPCKYRDSSLPAEFPKAARLDDDGQYLSFIQRQYTWAKGSNLFIGPKPQERGPFDPSQRKLDFELDAQIILGQTKYEQYFKIYKRIKKFIESQPHERTAHEAASIFILIDLMEEIYDIVSYNPEHWEKRVATAEELQLLKKSHRKKYLNKEYWAIKNIKQLQVQSVDGLADELSEVLTLGEIDI